MPRAPRQQIDDDDDSQELVQIHAAIPDPVEDEPETPADRVLALLKDHSADHRARMKVYKFTNNDWALCEEYTPEQFENGGFLLARDNWGPGKYSFRLYGPNPAGKMVHLGREVVELLAKPQLGPQHNPSQLEASATAQALQALNARLDAMQNRPQSDPMDSFTKMLNMMVLMRTAMGDDKKQPTVLEELQKLKALQEFSKEVLPADGGEKETNLLDLGKSVLGLIGQTQQNQPQQIQYSNPPVNPPVVRMPNNVRTPLPRVTAPETLAQAIAAGNAGDSGASAFVLPIKPQVPTGQIPAAPTPDNQPQENPMNNPVLSQEQIEADMAPLREQLKMLCLMAKIGAPTASAADIVYEKLPDEMFDLLALDGWFQMLVNVAPEVQPHQTWFTEVRDQVLEILEEENNSVDQIIGGGMTVYTDDGDGSGESGPSGDGPSNPNPLVN